MTLPRLALSVIGDEIGPSLEEMISFAHEYGLTRLDMRTVGGRNLLGMTKEEIITITCSRKWMEEIRRNWPFFRDRRIDHYGGLVKRVAD